MSRFSDPSGALRPATLSIAGLALATIAVVAIAANPGRLAAAPVSSPTPSAAPSATPAPTGPPVADPTAVPTAAPVATPRPTASALVTDGGSDAIPLTVDLETFDGHAVSIDIVDRTSSVATAVSGRPGDGASVEGGRVAVANLDERTLRLTWTDVPIDNRDALFVDEVNGHLRLLLIQPAATGPTDAIGFDRVLVLAFDHPVDGESVETMVQEGLDTAG